MNRTRSRARPNEISIGHVAGVFGVHGEVRLFLHNPASDLLNSERSVSLAAPDSARQQAHLLARPGAGKRVLGRVRGVTTPEGAAALVGSEILIDRAELPSLEEGTWYHADLIGVPVRTESGTDLGAIREIFSTGDQDIWVVVSTEGERFIPALKRLLVHVQPGVSVVVTDEAGLDPV